MCVWCSRSAVVESLTARLGNRRRFLAYSGYLAAGALLAACSADDGDNAGRGAGTEPDGDPTGPADVVFRNGPIYPMTPGHPRAEAIALRAGRIHSVGGTDEVMANADSSTRLIDLQGRTLLPGLIDPHNHTVLSSLFDSLLINIGFANHKTKADALAAMRSQVAATPEGDWLTFGFYDNLLQGGDWSMTELDAVSSTRPIFVQYVNGHVGAANSLAFARAKIAPDTGMLPGGGYFGRDADGKFTGLIYNEPALLRFLDIAVPKPTPASLTKAVRTYTGTAAAAGLTALHEPGTVKPEWVEMLAELSNSLPVRLSASFSTDMLEASRNFTALGPSDRARRIPNSRFSLYGMKYWADGSNQAETAAQTLPYLNSDSRGTQSYTTSQMVQLCQGAMDAGWTILCHCQGDAAVDEYLDAMEAVYGANPPSGLNRVEHARMARRDQIERMKNLGCEPTFMPDFIYLYGEAYRDQIFGPARAEFMVPIGAAAELGIGYSMHTDNPAAGLPVNPLRLVQTAVTRRCMTDNSVVGPDLRLTVDEALRGITTYAARQIGLGDVLGMLEKGKEADLTLLEDDPHTTDPDKLSAITVSETWLAGEKKFG